jgi:hypothetical protein
VREAPVVAGDRQADPAGRARPGVIVYSLMSGAVAVVAGAAASLTVTGAARIAVWCSVASATSIASGLAHDSAAVSIGWSNVRRWMRSFPRPL